MNRDQILDALGLQQENSGVYAGGWKQAGGDPITSYEPATETPIGSVTQASLEDYEVVVDSARAAFAEWRMVPPPAARQLHPAPRERPS